MNIQHPLLLSTHSIRLVGIYTTTVGKSSTIKKIKVTKEGGEKRWTKQRLETTGKKLN